MREAALNSRASRLEIDEQDLIKRRPELHNMINEQLKQERQVISSELQEGRDAQA